MASDAHAMLRSRDFGSSGSSEEGERDDDQEDGYYPRQQDHEQQQQQEQQYTYSDNSINNTTDPTTGGIAHQSSSQDDESQSYIGHQTASNNLASFEESFIPEDNYHHDNVSPDGDTRPKPKTPSAKEVQSKQRRVISDAAGFTRHVTSTGQRDIFAEREGEGMVDLSQHDVGEGSHQHRSRGAGSRQSRRADDNNNNSNNQGEEEEEEGDGTSGLNEQPSFERSDSQSMRVETVTTRRGGKAANTREADSSRQVKAGSKQQLTLREQEKVSYALLRLCRISRTLYS